MKFTQSGHVALRVEPGTDRPATAGSAHPIRFRVSDTGIGMTQEQMGRLFHAFTQADGTTTRKFGGTGLGLTISKRLVEMMGGAIQVSSAPGEGTTFSFEIPFAVAPDAALAPSRTLPPQLVGARVLVVDDNGASRHFLGSMLGSLGLEVTSAASGQEALAAIRAAGAESFQLVLMDWKMPGMDGIEAARRIKRDERAARVPAILMVTAYGNEEMERASEEAGVDAFLVKPVNRARQLDAILETFDLEPSPWPGRAPARRPGTEAPLGLRGARVLLVEDNEINQLVAREFLEQAGILVSMAGDGSEAVRAVQAERFDLVFMDVQMPIMDGYSAARAIRDLEEHAAPLGPRGPLPIVAMTAHAMADERDKCAAAGMDDYLSKPFRSEQLFAVLRKWIPAGEPPQTPPAPAPSSSAEADAPEPGAPAPDAADATPALTRDPDAGPAEPQAPKAGPAEDQAPKAGPAEDQAPKDDPAEDQANAPFASLGETPGLDVSAGLDMMGGNEVLYLELLKIFIRDNEETVSSLRDALQSGERASAERIAHTVKGSAAAIGAMELSRTAEQVERGVRQGEFEAADLDPSGFEVHLTQAIASMAAVLRQASAADLSQW